MTLANCWSIVTGFYNCAVGAKFKLTTDNQ